MNFPFNLMMIFYTFILGEDMTHRCSIYPKGRVKKGIQAYYRSNT